MSLTLHPDGDAPPLCPQGVGGLALVGPGSGVGDHRGLSGGHSGPVVATDDGGGGVAGGQAGQSLECPPEPRPVGGTTAGREFGRVWGREWEIRNCQKAFWGKEKGIWGRFAEKMGI